MVEPKIISEKSEFKSDWFEVFSVKLRFQDNKEAKWNYLKCNDSVSVVPVDSDGNVYLVKEWRPAWKKYLIEVPGGECKFYTEEGRIKQARNELMEEVGMDCRKLIKLCSMPYMSRLGIFVHMYLATELFKSKKEGDEHEYIEILKMPLDKAIDWLLPQESTPPLTLLGLLLAKEKLRKNK